MRKKCGHIFFIYSEFYAILSSLIPKKNVFCFFNGIVHYQQIYIQHRTAVMKGTFRNHSPCECCFDLYWHQIC